MHNSNENGEDQENDDEKLAQIEHLQNMVSHIEQLMENNERRLMELRNHQAMIRYLLKCIHYYSVPKNDNQKYD